MKHYVYKITFEEVPHFYIGVRGRDPEGDPYLGSPKTHRCYWEIYTPKKQILWVFNSWEEACDVETALIKQNWDNRYCLNECAGRAFSLDARAKGAKTFHDRRGKDPEFDSKFRENSAKGAKAREERRQKDLGFDDRLRKASAKGAKALHERRRKDPELDAEFRENCARNVKTREERRKSDPEFDAKFRADSAKGAKALEERRRKDSEFDAMLRANSVKAGAKGAKALHERREKDPEFAAMLREINSKTAKITNAQRWQCTVTGHISNAGGLSRYQRARGIDPSNRRRID